MSGSSTCNEQDTLSLAYSDSCIADDKSLPDMTRQDSHRAVMNLPQKLFFTSPQDWSDSDDDDDDDSFSDCGTSNDTDGTPGDEDTPTDNRDESDLLIPMKSWAFPSLPWNSGANSTGAAVKLKLMSTKQNPKRVI